MVTLWLGNCECSLICNTICNTIKLHSVPGSQSARQARPSYCPRTSHNPMMIAGMALALNPHHHLCSSSRITGLALGSRAVSTIRSVNLGNQKQPFHFRIKILRAKEEEALSRNKVNTILIKSKRQKLPLKTAPGEGEMSPDICLYMP